MELDTYLINTDKTIVDACMFGIPFFKAKVSITLVPKEESTDLKAIIEFWLDDTEFYRVAKFLVRSDFGFMEDEDEYGNLLVFAEHYPITFLKKRSPHIEHLE